MQLQQVFSQAEQIVISNEGEREVYPAGSAPFKEICARWSAMLSNSIVMPAYGVSLDNITREAVKKGVWAEFVFSKQLKINELPFERLLVEVKPDYMGFNVVRYNSDGGYAGRCFYIDLGGTDMADMYEYLKSLK